MPERPSRHRRLAGLIALLLAALVAAPVGSAAAVSYASKSSPLSVSGYGSWGKTYGNWNASRSSSTKIRSYLSSAYYRYKDADDHTVYATMNTTVPGHAELNNETSHDNVYNAWTAFRSRPDVSLYPSSSGTAAVRAAVRTCLDIPWRSDPCSSSSRTMTLYR